MATRLLVGRNGIFRANRFAGYPLGKLPEGAEPLIPGLPIKSIISDDSFNKTYLTTLEEVAGERRIVQQQGPLPGMSGSSPAQGQMIADPNLTLFENPRVIAEFSWTGGYTILQPGVFVCAVSNGVTWLHFTLFYDVINEQLRLMSTDFRNASVVFNEALDMSAAPLIEGRRYLFKLERLPSLLQGKVWEKGDEEPDFQLSHVIEETDKPLGICGIKCIHDYTATQYGAAYCYDYTVESATARPIADRIPVSPDVTISARRFVDVPLGELPLRDDSLVKSRVIQEYYPGTGRAPYMTLEMVPGDTGEEKAIHVQYKGVTGYTAVMIEAPKARGMKYPRVYAELEWVNVGGGQKRIGIFCNTEDGNVNKWNYRLIYDMALQQIRLGLSDDTSSGFSGVVALDRVLADETRYGFLLERLPALIRGKIWPVAEAEPEEWDVQKVIPLDERIGGMHGFCHTSTTNDAGGGMAGYCYDLQVSATDARRITARELV